MRLGLIRCRYESYLQHSDPVVLALNPFFVLEYVRFTPSNFILLTFDQKRPNTVAQHTTRASGLTRHFVARFYS